MRVKGESAIKNDLKAEKIELDLGPEYRCKQLGRTNVNKDG
jgi:hypothetical protein